jgi:hypothetical protein
LDSEHPYPAKKYAYLHHDDQLLSVTFSELRHNWGESGSLDVPYPAGYEIQAVNAKLRHRNNALSD